MKVDLEEVNWQLHENPFDAYMDFRIERIEEGGRAELSFYPKKENFANGKGIMHGGGLYALADSAMGVACYSLGKPVVSLDLSLNYLAAVQVDCRILAKAAVVHNGRKTMVCTCDFYDENGRHLGYAKGTFFVIEPKEGAEA